MTKKQHLILIILFGIIMTLIVNLGLTRAIIFGDYLRTKEILSGGGYYLALVNESSKGNWNLGSPFLKEWSDKEYLYPSLNINIAGFFKKIFNLDLKTASIVLSYLCIFIIAVLAIITFLFAFRFHYFGYLAAAAFMFFPRMIGWGQAISPQTNFIFLFLFLMFYFWPTFQSAPRSLGVGVTTEFWKREIGLAVSTGLLFYTYPYHWTYALPLLVLSDAWEFFKEKKIDWKRMIKYPLILLFASWYLSNLWNISNLSYYKETMARIGALYSRWPAGILTQAIIFLLLLLFGAVYKYIFLRRNFFVNSADLSKIVIGLLVTFIVLNQQLITGMQLEFNSHYLPVILIFATALVGALILIFCENVRHGRTVITVAAWLIVLFFAGRFIYFNTRTNFENYLSPKELETIEWFINNEIRNEVIYAPRQLNAPINLITSNYLYFHDSQELHLMPTEELIDRFTYFDVLNREITDNLIDQQVSIFGQIFKSAWQKDNVVNRIKSLLSGKQFKPATLESYTKYDFEPMRQKRLRPDLKEFEAHLEKYNVDYLVYEARYRDGIYRYIPGDVVFDNGAYIIKNRRQ